MKYNIIIIASIIALYLTGCIIKPLHKHSKQEVVITGNPTYPTNNNDEITLDDTPPDAPYIKNLSEKPILYTSWNRLDNSTLGRRTPENMSLTISFLINDSRTNDELANQQVCEGRNIAAIQKEVAKHTDNGSIYWNPPWVSQYINARITSIEISCNNTLWGIEPGKNLIDKFVLWVSSPPMMFHYPDGQYMGNIGEILNPNHNKERGYKVDWKEVLDKCYAPDRICFVIYERFDEKPELVKYNIKLILNDNIVLSSSSTVQYEYE